MLLGSINMNLTDSIKSLKNIGPGREKEFALLGIFSVQHLLYFFPKSYKTRADMKPIEYLQPEEEASIIATPTGAETIYRGRTSITKVCVQDKTGSIDCVFYNQPYVKNNLILGVSYIFSGKVTKQGKRCILSSPQYEKESAAEDSILPLYKFSSQKVIRKIIKDVLQNTKISEIIPTFLREQLGLESASTAFCDIHFPKNEAALIAAKKYLATEELLVFQLALYSLRGNIKKSSPIKITHSDITPILSSINFSLTNAQNKVLKEIISDMKSGQTMYRLLQGDVGSGKTIIAIIACYILLKNGYQAVLMVPTGILAAQHYESFTEILEPLGVNVQLLTGNMKGKRAVLENISSGNAQVIVATHAAISHNVSFHNLGLVITDEQHRFGVRQRQALENKGQSPHVIVMSATPIPRTLALILYGDLDISTIDQLPKGRTPINTYHVNTSYRERVWTFLEKEAVAGYQSYIVCPAIESEDLTSVTDYVEEIREYYRKKNSHLAGRVAYLHGKMDEKDDIMQAFKKGLYSVLIATTVVEVGVNLQNATVMVIEDAHRFGLSQLHQLRGRVGRGEAKSYCILVSDTKGEMALSRIRAMIDHSDGFHLSQMDLNLRGPGEFFGVAQHGILNLKVADLQRDMDIVRAVQDCVSDIYKHLDNYPELKYRVSDINSEVDCRKNFSP